MEDQCPGSQKTKIKCQLLLQVLSWHPIQIPRSLFALVPKRVSRDPSHSQPTAPQWHWPAQALRSWLISLPLNLFCFLVNCLHVLFPRMAGTSGLSWPRSPQREGSCSSVNSAWNDTGWEWQKCQWHPGAYSGWGRCQEGLWLTDPISFPTTWQWFRETELSLDSV